MAENEPPVEPPTPPTGLPALPAGSQPPALPPGLNADEYRRFQEFQRFQDYQRFVQGQRGQPGGVPMPAPQHGLPAPPPQHDVAEQLAGVRQHLAELSTAQAQINRTLNPPLWKKILRSTWLHRAVWLVVIVLLAVWGIPALVEHFIGGNNDSNSASPFRPKEETGRLPTDPKLAVYAIYKYIGDDDSDSACNAFNDTARAQFVASVGEKGCGAAVDKLSRQVTDPSQYEMPGLSQLPESPGSTATISSCSFAVNGGPILGTFTLTKVAAGWEITAYQAPMPCPAPTSASTPPTS